MAPWPGANCSAANLAFDAGNGDRRGSKLGEMWVQHGEVTRNTFWKVGNTKLNNFWVTPTNTTAKLGERSPKTKIMD